MDSPSARIDKPSMTVRPPSGSSTVQPKRMVDAERVRLLIDYLAALERASGAVYGLEDSVRRAVSEIDRILITDR